MKILVRLLAILPVVGLVLTWLIQGIPHLERQRDLARIADDLRPLFRYGPAERPRPIAVRGKVLVWDVPANRVRQATHDKLTKDRLATSIDEPVTVFAILSIKRDQKQQYNNGIVGFQQTATVRVIYWPEKRTLATHTVVGHDPPLIVFRQGNDVSPELGDLDGPLAEWIKRFPDENDPQFQETLARLAIVDSVEPLLRVQLPPLEARVDPIDLQMIPNELFAPRPKRQPREEKLPAVSGKFLVWDMKLNAMSPVHNLLPEELRGGPADRELTVVGILQTDEVKARTYQNDKVGYRRIVAVGLASWPEKKLLGVHTVVGEDPPAFFIAIGKEATEPIRGEVDKPLAEWIKRLPHAR